MSNEGHEDVTERSNFEQSHSFDYNDEIHIDTNKKDEQEGENNHLNGNSDASTLEVMTDSLAKAGIKPQFKRQMPDGTLIDTDVSYLDFLHQQARLASTAQAIYGASDEAKTEWAIAMKDYANALYREGHFSKAMEKYVECLTASKFSSEISETDSSLPDNIDNLVLPVLCNLSACCIQLKEWGKAIKFCEEALKLRPRCVKAIIRYGKAQLQLGEYSRAIESLSRGESIINDDTNQEYNGDLQQIQQLLKQANVGLEKEKRADIRRKNALMKAFRQVPSNAKAKKGPEEKKETSHEAKESDSDKDSPSSFIRYLLQYIYCIWMRLSVYFVRKVEKIS